MIKLIKTIVNKDRILIGFFIEGKDRELGGVTDEKVIRRFKISELIRCKFENSQVAVVGNKIIEKRKFRINELPMAVLSNGELIDIDNKIDIVRRIVKGNKQIGFTVRFYDGTALNLLEGDIIRLITWYKPGNFYVRESAKGKKFISGRQNVLRISELKVLDLDEKDRKRKMKENAKNFSNDLMGILKFLKLVGGIIVCKPDKNEYTDREGFNKRNLGKYAYPEIQYNSTTVNGSVSFRDLGVVNIELAEAGALTSVKTYRYKKEIIVRNGKMNIDSLCVGVPKGEKKRFLSIFSELKAIEFEDIDTEGAIAVLEHKEYKFIEIDAKSLPVISSKGIEKNLIANKEIKNLTEKEYVCKLINKYLTAKDGIIQSLKKRVSIDNKKREVHAAFSGMSSNMIEKIRRMGIDVYSGAYKVKSNYIKDPSKKRLEDYLDIEIRYIVGNRDHREMTYTKMRELYLEGSKLLPKELVKYIDILSAIVNSTERLNKAMTISGDAERVLDKINTKLWMHKCAMVIMGDWKKVHTHDANKWKQDKSNRYKANVYECKDKDCEGLSIRVRYAEI